MQTGKRSIFAIGSVQSKLNFFISGFGGSSKTLDAYRLEVEGEPSDGVFKLSPSALHPLSITNLPSSLSNTPVIFVCSDSFGANLAAMTDTSVAVAKLPTESGSFTPTAITSKGSGVCYFSGVLHFSTGEPTSPEFYTIDKKGYLNKFSFVEGNTISNATSCSGNLYSACLSLSEKEVSVNKTSRCYSGVFPPNIISAYVGYTTAYFIDGANSVYVFPSSVFKENKNGKRVVIKVDASMAWRADAFLNFERMVMVLGIVVIVLIIFGWIYYFFGKKDSKKDANTKRKDVKIVDKSIKIMKSIKGQNGSKSVVGQLSTANPMKLHSKTIKKESSQVKRGKSSHVQAKSLTSGSSA